MKTREPFGWIVDAFDFQPNGVERIGDRFDRRFRLEEILKPGERELQAGVPTPAESVGTSSAEKP